ncbi:MAG: LysR family transcriptional regulator [Gemmataceae bacterium]|nr:LysR family transcriptional regulator [Gemmataceae bacterium]
MHITSLKVFCDVARQRSFSQAAHANDVTQSAVSQIVSQLEKRMQVKLVDRSTRPLQLTPLGQTFYEGCQALLEQYGELESSIKNAQAEIAGSVQVAAIYSVGLGDMGQFVQRFVSAQPKASVHIDYLHPDAVYERVESGTADLGLVSFPRKSPKLVALPWRDEDMVLACSPKHALAGNLAVPLQELSGQKYVHFDRKLTIRRQVDRFLRGHGATVKVVLEFDNIENIKQAVAIGAGVALLPEPTLRREVKARTLAAVPLYKARFTRPLGIIHRRRHLSAVARRFLELLRESAGLRNGEPGTHAGGVASLSPSRNGDAVRSK